MLKKIYFRNFLNFKNEQVLEFNDKENVYAIYGKNAAGKSNFLTVIAFVQKTIVGDISEIYLKKIKNRYTNDNDLEISIIVTVNNINYFYALKAEADSGTVVSQELYRLNKKMNRLESKLIEFTDGTVKSDVLNEKKLEILNQYNIEKNGVFKFIRELKESDEINEIKKFMGFFGQENISSKGLETLYTDNELRRKVVNELKKIDTGIEDIKITEVSDRLEEMVLQMEQNGKTDIPKDLIENIKKNRQFQVEAYHDGDVLIEMKRESEGTNKYFKQLVEYFTSTEIYGDERIFIEDELDRSYHDDVFEKFIAFFKENFKSQLIFTTHNQIVLEKKLLNKQNIIIIDKIGNESTIYKLSDFKEIRNDEKHNWRNLYNDFRLGGKPNVK